jgi:hypothetical protein
MIEESLNSAGITLKNMKLIMPNITPIMPKICPWLGPLKPLSVLIMDYLT